MVSRENIVKDSINTSTSLILNYIKNDEKSIEKILDKCRCSNCNNSRFSIKYGKITNYNRTNGNIRQYWKCNNCNHHGVQKQTTKIADGKQLIEYYF